MAMLKDIQGRTKSKHVFGKWLRSQRRLFYDFRRKVASSEVIAEFQPIDVEDLVRLYNLGPAQIEIASSSIVWIKYTQVLSAT